MGKMKNWLYRFMYGRYGGDTLNKVLLFTYLGWVIAYSVVSMFWVNPYMTFAYLLVSYRFNHLVTFYNFVNMVGSNRF